MELIIGDKAFSTWSLRPWLILKRAGATFGEIQIFLDQPNTTAEILRHSPTAKVPALKVDGEVIWDSLAIAEWCAEQFPEANLWPADARARAMARSVVAEFHAGFGALRNECSMGPDKPMVGPGGPMRPVSGAVGQEIARLIEMIRTARGRFGAGGPYMFGQWSIADAFYTPVATRVRRHGIDLASHGDEGAVVRAYFDMLLNEPDFLEWERAGLAERR